MSTKRKATAKIAPPIVKQSAKAPTKSWVNEAQATVTASAPVSSISTIEISSDSSSNYDEDSDGEEASDDEQAATSHGARAGVSAEERDAEDADARIASEQDPDTEMLSPPHKEVDEDTSDAELAAPSFGDLIRNHEVDVANALAPQQEPTPDSQLQPRTKTIAPPSLSSLGTVLTQALRTDDNDLLESCLHTTELKVVQNTIQRMDSSLAGILLTKLAARMHRRPGRAHSLMSWVQWSLIAHGGALSTDPDVVKRLGELNKVLDERSRGLPSLLALKGKLDMLDGQMQLRRDNRKAGSRTGQSLGGLDDDEEDEREQGIIYVEGEEDMQINGAKGLRRAGEEDDYLITNGVADSDDDEEDDDDDMDVDDADLLDEESLDEDEVDHDDIEESGEEDDSEVEPAAPPPKVQKTAKAFSKRK